MARLTAAALFLPVVAAAAALAPSAASAATVCDAYSRGCVPASGPVVAPERRPAPAPTVERQPTGGRPVSGQLPFTGAELTLVVGLGAAAVGAGAVMTAAGRRRRQPV